MYPDAAINSRSDIEFLFFIKGALMQLLPMTADQLTELFHSFSRDALIYADDSAWQLSFIPGHRSAYFVATAPTLMPLLEQVVAQLASIQEISGFAVRLVVPSFEVRVIHDAIQHLLAAMVPAPERPLCFAAVQGGPLFELHLLVQGKSS